MHKICQLDRNGFLIGVSEPEESPLEPGALLIPAGAILAKEPERIPGMVPKFDPAMGEWLQVQQSKVLATPSGGLDDAATGEKAVQILMDNRARAMGYESLLVGISYAGEDSVPEYAADGKKLRAWRSAVWQWFYAGDFAELQIDALAKLMPALN